MIPAKLVAEMREKKMSAESPVLVRIFKKESELEVWKQDASGRFALLKTYPMCRWSGKLGPKTKTGDRQAPEGFYHVSAGMLNPKSQYYLSFNLGYPNRLESALGYTGEALMVHGPARRRGVTRSLIKVSAKSMRSLRNRWLRARRSSRFRPIPSA